MVIFIEPFVELNELDHEAIVGTCNTSFLLYKMFGLFVVIAQLEDDVGDDEGHRPGDPLDAVY